MKRFIYFAILYLIGNILVVSILGGLISSALPQETPLFVVALLLFGLVLSSLSLLFYLYTQRK
jgi:hypothetical protein